MYVGMTPLELSAEMLPYLFSEPFNISNWKFFDQKKKAVFISGLPMRSIKRSFESLVLAYLISTWRGPVSCRGGPARCAPPIEQLTKMSSAWATDKHCLPELRNNQKEQQSTSEVRGGWQLGARLHPFCCHQSPTNFQRSRRRTQRTSFGFIHFILQITNVCALVQGGFTAVHPFQALSHPEDELRCLMTVTHWDYTLTKNASLTGMEKLLLKAALRHSPELCSKDGTAHRTSEITLGWGVWRRKTLKSLQVQLLLPQLQTSRTTKKTPHAVVSHISARCLGFVAASTWWKQIFNSCCFPHYIALCFLFSCKDS